jgi:hypothetical protein
LIIVESLIAVGLIGIVVESLVIEARIGVVVEAGVGIRVLLEWGRGSVIVIAKERLCLIVISHILDI